MKNSTDVKKRLYFASALLTIAIISFAVCAFSANESVSPLSVDPTATAAVPPTPNPENETATGGAVEEYVGEDRKYKVERVDLPGNFDVTEPVELYACAMSVNEGHRAAVHMMFTHAVEDVGVSVTGYSGYKGLLTLGLIGDELTSLVEVSDDSEPALCSSDDRENIGAELKYIAPLTSPENPLYIVYGTYGHYYIVGDTAYIFELHDFAKEYIGTFEVPENTFVHKFTFK